MLVVTNTQAPKHCQLVWPAELGYLIGKAKPRGLLQYRSFALALAPVVLPQQQLDCGLADSRLADLQAGQLC